ncbi:MAG: glycosyltransferase family 2 protein [Thioalkalivibrionaceae bacterium]
MRPTKLNTDTIGIVIPVYNEGEHLAAHLKVVFDVLNGMANVSWRMLIVDDGSTDNSANVLASLQSREPRLTSLSLTRNFGKEAAILAGLDHFVSHPRSRPHSERLGHSTSVTRNDTSEANNAPALRHRGSNYDEVADFDAVGERAANDVPRAVQPGDSPERPSSRQDSTVEPPNHCARAVVDAIIVMDSDLQHPPELIAPMLELWRGGAAVVDACKQCRQSESLIRRSVARGFYRLFRNLVGLDLSQASDFKLLDISVAEAYCALPERDRFFRGIVGWMAYPSATIPFDVPQDTARATRWGFISLLRYATRSITSFSSAPLHWVSVLGALVFISSLAVLAKALYDKATGTAVEGFTTVIILLLMLGSALMLSLGLLGLYVARIYEQVKGRPPYVAHNIDVQRPSQSPFIGCRSAVDPSQPPTERDAMSDDHKEAKPAATVDANDDSDRTGALPRGAGLNSDGPSRPSHTAPPIKDR